MHNIIIRNVLTVRITEEESQRGWTGGQWVMFVEMYYTYFLNIIVMSIVIFQQKIMIIVGVAGPHNRLTEV